ncbi:hypothetical protein [Microbacterium sp. 2FI]|uniref:hypothetical protein n=1 Tax=Microbacterium sp. 2FI TaxID=2502193 RepID=UPI0010F8A944|nr:hypothetical protein [Microbacterium sp. 2FI]
MTVEFVDATEVELPELPATVLDEDAVRQVLWFFGRPGGREPGGFRSALFEAMAVADQENFSRLYSAFPVLGFWFDALKSRSDGVTLAVRALDLLGVKA